MLDEDTLAGLEEMEPDPLGLVRVLHDDLMNLCAEVREARDPTNAATDAFNEIAKACGCPEWDYPGQLVRDVQAVVRLNGLLHKIIDMQVAAPRTAAVLQRQRDYAIQLAHGDSRYCPDCNRELLLEDIGAPACPGCGVA